MMRRMDRRVMTRRLATTLAAVGWSLSLAINAGASTPFRPVGIHATQAAFLSSGLLISRVGSAGDAAVFYCAAQPYHVTVFVYPTEKSARMAYGLVRPYWTHDGKPSARTLNVVVVVKYPVRVTGPPPKAVASAMLSLSRGLR
jgi:hypothetical protein